MTVGQEQTVLSLSARTRPGIPDPRSRIDQAGSVHRQRDSNCRDYNREYSTRRGKVQGFLYVHYISSFIAAFSLRHFIDFLTDLGHFFIREIVDKHKNEEDQQTADDGRLAKVVFREILRRGLVCLQQRFKTDRVKQERNKGGRQRRDQEDHKGDNRIDRAVIALPGQPSLVVNAIRDERPD